MAERLQVQNASQRPASAESRPRPFGASESLHAGYKEPRRGTSSATTRIEQHNKIIAPRPPPPTTPQGRAFWNSVFQEGIKAFLDRHPTEPKGRVESGHSIRDVVGWNDIHSRLEAARAVYENPRGVLGSLTKGFRKASDNAKPVSRLLQAVPSTDYVSPVISAVSLILEGALAASDLRRDVGSAFDDMGTKIQDVETYLAMFPDDQNIMDASVDLVVSIIKAFEDVIGYYIKSKLPKALAAFYFAEDYQTALKESLEDIKTSGDALAHQVHNSNMWQNRQALLISGESSVKISKVQEVTLTIADSQNETKILLERIDRNLQLHMETKEQRTENPAQKATAHPHDEGIDLNSQYEASPRPASLLPASEGFPMFPAYHPPGSPHPSLLDQGANGPIMMAAHHIADPSLQHPFAAPQLAPPTRDVRQVLALLNTPQLDTEDLNFVRSRRGTFRAPDNERAAKIRNYRQYINWAQSPSSAALLIHADFDGTMYVSPLSAFAAGVYDGLKGGDYAEYLPLVYFCGRHVDAKAHAHTGAWAMMASLCEQLLRRYPYNPAWALDAEWIDYRRIGEGDVGEMCELFAHLIRVLPPETSVVCIVDGVKYYERQEFWRLVKPVMECLVELARERAGEAVFKVLATSPAPTSDVRHVFGAERTLSMAAHR